jgi:hypothetical protein
MVLDATTKSLQIDLAGAITTNQLVFIVDWVDVFADGTFKPGNSHGLTNGTTAVEMVAAPALSTTQRIIRYISVYQKDTANATVTVQELDSATIREGIVTLLQPGHTLEWTPENGWRIAALGAASDTAAGIIEIATQAEMEAGTDVLRAVTPGRQHFHPSACKAWGMAAGAGSLTTSYNITSITDTGTGRLGVNIATDMSSANYSIIAQIQRGTTTLTVADVEQCAIRNASQTAGVFEIESYDHTATTLAADDPAQYYWACFGDI